MKFYQQVPHKISNYNLRLQQEYAFQSHHSSIRNEFAMVKKLGGSLLIICTSMFGVRHILAIERSREVINNN